MSVPSISSSPISTTVFSSAPAESMKDIFAKKFFASLDYMKSHCPPLTARNIVIVALIAATASCIYYVKRKDSSSSGPKGAHVSNVQTTKHKKEHCLAVVLLQLRWMELVEDNEENANLDRKSYFASVLVGFLFLLLLDPNKKQSLKKIRQSLTKISPDQQPFRKAVYKLMVNKAEQISQKDLLQSEYWELKKHFTPTYSKMTEESLRRGYGETCAYLNSSDITTLPDEPEKLDNTWVPVLREIHEILKESLKTLR